MTKKNITVLTISLVVIVAALALNACAAGVLASPSGLEAQVGTAAAATVVQHMIETQVAVQSRSLAAEPPVQAQPTNTPLPADTATPVPTATAQPTQAPSPTPVPTDTPAAVVLAAANPQIVADQNTNCRYGPGTGYTIKTVFMKGSQSTVHGRNDGKSWWYIANPNASGDYCWVWEGSTTVVGDTSTVAVVAAPSISKSTVDYYNYSWSNWCGSPYVHCANYYNYCDDCVYYWDNCNWKKWEKCDPCTYDEWKRMLKNRCNWKPRRSHCPAVTPINYRNYCSNYPQCCDLDDDDLNGN